MTNYKYNVNVNRMLHPLKLIVEIFNLLILCPVVFLDMKQTLQKRIQPQSSFFPLTYRPPVYTFLLVMLHMFQSGYSRLNKLATSWNIFFETQIFTHPQIYVVMYLCVYVYTYIFIRIFRYSTVFYAESDGILTCLKSIFFFLTSFGFFLNQGFMCVFKNRCMSRLSSQHRRELITSPAPPKSSHSTQLVDVST